MCSGPGAGEGWRGWIIRETQTIRASVQSSHRGTGRGVVKKQPAGVFISFSLKVIFHLEPFLPSLTDFWYFWGPQRVSNSVHKKLKPKNMIKWCSWKVNLFGNSSSAGPAWLLTFPCWALPLYVNLHPHPLWPSQISSSFLQNQYQTSSASSFVFSLMHSARCWVQILFAQPPLHKNAWQSRSLSFTSKPALMGSLSPY